MSIVNLQRYCLKSRAVRPVCLQLLMVLCIVDCSNELAVQPVQPLEGNCVGVIRDQSGNAVQGASVQIVPDNYTPLSPENILSIDSTVSDAFGRYSFTVSTAGAFNLISNNNKLYAMRKSILVSPHATLALKDEVLSEPGSLTGAIHLAGKTNHRAGVALFIGTNRYAAPNDSSGNFAVEGIAPGVYTLRMLATEPGFETAETTVVITSGKQTVLPQTELQQQFVAAIDSLKVAYNSAVMMATLSWKPLDSTRISGYTIYLNRSMNPEPVARLNSSCSTLTLDVILQDIDTFCYQVVALEKDGSLGPFCAGEPFAKTSMFKQKTATAIAVTTIFTPMVKAIDGEGNVYLATNTITSLLIEKIDTSGHVVATSQFADTIDDLFDLKVDQIGSIYAKVVKSVGVGDERLRSGWLMKLNPDLTVDAELRLDFGNRHTFIPLGSDSLLLFFCENSENAPTATYAALYNGNFEKISEVKLGDTWIDSSLPDQTSLSDIFLLLNLEKMHVYGNSIYSLVNVMPYYHANHREEVQMIKNNLATFLSHKSVIFIDNQIPQSFGLGINGYTDFTLGPEGRTVVRTSTNSKKFPALLSFFTADKQLICRVPWDNCENVCFFNNNGTISFARNSTGKVLIFRYSVEDVPN